MEKIRIIGMSITSFMLTFAILTCSHSFANTSAVTVTSEKAKISVTVPTSFALAVKADGTTIGGEGEIINNSAAPVKITDVKLSPAEGWSLVNGNANLDAENIGTKKLGLVINGVVGQADGTFAVDETAFPVINRRETKPIIWNGVSTMFSDEVATATGATVVYTIGFAK